MRCLVMTQVLLSCCITSQIIRNQLTCLHISSWLYWIFQAKHSSYLLMAHLKLIDANQSCCIASHLTNEEQLSNYAYLLGEFYNSWGHKPLSSWLYWFCHASKLSILPLCPWLFEVDWCQSYREGLVVFFSVGLKYASRNLVSANLLYSWGARNCRNLSLVSLPTPADCCYFIRSLNVVSCKHH